MLVDEEGKGAVELFERGYGKDAAGIAKEAIAYGTCWVRESSSYLSDLNVL